MHAQIEKQYAAKEFLFALLVNVVTRFFNHLFHLSLIAACLASVVSDILRIILVLTHWYH